MTIAVTSIPRTVLTDVIPELTTPILGLTLVDELGAVITTPTTVVGTLYDVSSGQVINSRTNFDLTPFMTAGVLSWRTAKLDMAVFSTKKDYNELHRLLVQWTWNSGNQSGAHEIDHYVAVIPKSS